MIWLSADYIFWYVYCRPTPAEPSQMKCKLVGSSQIPVGDQSRLSDVHINIKDKYGNDIVHVSIVVGLLTERSVSSQ